MRITSLIFMLGVALMSRAAPAAAENLAAVAPMHDCDSLRGFDPALPDFPTKITDTATVRGTGLPYCRVRGIISPSIHFEVHLPTQGWTQRCLQTGCGGLCGSLDIRAPQRACPALDEGAFAMASSDMGHSGMGGEWAANNPQLQADFAYRGMHGTAVVAKALIARFYGQQAKWSYFSDCSDGGREALMEAQRYRGHYKNCA